MAQRFIDFTPCLPFFYNPDGTRTGLRINARSRPHLPWAASRAVDCSLSRPKAKWEMHERHAPGVMRRLQCARPRQPHPLKGG